MDRGLKLSQISVIPFSHYSRSFLRLTIVIVIPLPPPLFHFPSPTSLPPLPPFSLSPHVLKLDPIPTLHVPLPVQVLNVEVVVAVKSPKHALVVCRVRAIHVVVDLDL